MKCNHAYISSGTDWNKIVESKLIVTTRCKSKLELKKILSTNEMVYLTLFVLISFIINFF